MKEKIYALISHTVVAALSALLALALFGGSAAAETTQSKLEELENLILTCFVGQTDATALEDAAADAMVTATGDRWSYYIPASEYAAYVEQMENAYVGVGITIQLEEGQGFRILEVTPGGPAQEAGIQVKDLIVAVEEQDVRAVDVNQVRDLVRGEAGTFVSLTVLRGEESLTLRVERRQVQVPVASWELIAGDVGLITIENFDDRCARETIDAIQSAMKVGARKLIFDVRYNPGGYADELVDVLDYLLPEGEVFHTVDYKGKELIDYSDADCLNLPMAVLVNASSYSAAEFFAAALSEYEAAIVVGEQTSGKGYFQNTFRLRDGSAVSLSVGKYYTPKGNNLAGIGITPDVVVQVDEETAAGIYYRTLTPEEDPQVQAAIAALNG